jgi:electron transport complex protein RnfC
MAKSYEQLIQPKPFRRGLDLSHFQAVAAPSIEEMPVPKRVYIPLKQHKGSWCQPKVAVGDQVKMGQVLGESADPESAPVHASVSGEVLSLGDQVDPFGRKVPTVIIENNGQDEWLTPPTANPAYMKKKVSAMIKAVRESGLVQTATGKPINTLLAPPERPRSYIFLVGIPLFRPIELLVASALDCESTVSVNRSLLAAYPGEVHQGIELIKKLVGAKNAVLALEDDFKPPPGWLGAVTGDGLEIVSIKNRYPVARPELLTTALTGREVPWPGGDTRDVGVLVLNIKAILGVLEAVRSGRPQIDRVISLRGTEISSRNIKVRLGTPLSDVLAFAGTSFDRAAKVVMGGLMDGSAQYDPRTPVTKQTPAVQILTSRDLVEITEQLCIKCGRCVSVCPMRLLPNVMTNYCEFGRFEDAAEAELFSCIECGCCAYVCPARRPLVHYVKHGKAEVTAMRAAR